MLISARHFSIFSRLAAFLSGTIPLALFAILSLTLATSAVRYDASKKLVSLVRDGGYFPFPFSAILLIVISFQVPNQQMQFLGIVIWVSWYSRGMSVCGALFFVPVQNLTLDQRNFFLIPFPIAAAHTFIRGGVVAIVGFIEFQLFCFQSPDPLLQFNLGLDFGGFDVLISAGPSQDLLACPLL